MILQSIGEGKLNRRRQSGVEQADDGDADGGGRDEDEERDDDYDDCDDYGDYDGMLIKVGNVNVI